MLRILFVSVILCLFSKAIGQEAFGAVHLKDGSIVKGNIIENTPTGVKVETCCGSIFYFQPDEIKTIIKDQGGQKFMYKRGSRILVEMDQEDRILNYNKGSMVLFSSGILLGNFWNAKQAILSTIVEYNYRFIPYLAAGVLVGYETLNESTIPVAINVKALYPVKNHDVFIGFSGGHNYSVESPDEYIYEHHSGGVMFNIEAGTRFRLSHNNSFFIAAGYRYNELHYRVNDWWIDTINRTIYFNRFSFRIGLVLF